MGLKVQYKYGTKAQYKSLTSYDEGSLYFLTDTGELYRGAVPIGQSHFYSGTVQNEETLAQALARVTASAANVPGDFCFIAKGDVTTTYIYYDDAWKKIASDEVSASNIVLSSGDTLEEALTNLEVDIDVDEASVDLDSEGKLILKNFGQWYYKFTGSEDENDEDGHSNYDKVTVDATHPWPAGLEPRIDVDGKLAWFEPNPTTIEGLSSQLETLAARVDDLDDRAGLRAVLVDGSALTVSTDKEVSLPIFGVAASSGLVPVPSSTLSTEEKAVKFLNANGVWATPVDGRIGDLTLNSVQYSTVEEYVDAAIEAAMTWTSIV